MLDAPKIVNSFSGRLDFVDQPYPQPLNFQLVPRVGYLQSLELLIPLKFVTILIILAWKPTNQDIMSMITLNFIRGQDRFE